MGQDHPYPSWENIQETLAKILESVVRSKGFCPRQIDAEDLFHQAFFRLRTYYQRGIARGNIQKFEAWCRLKALSAARDERRQVLGRSAEGVEYIPLEIEHEGGDSEERAEIASSPAYRSQTLDDVVWGMQDIVRQVLIEHAKADPESVDIVLLYDGEDLTAAEIAAQRHKTERQITYIVQKDRKSIEQLLKARNITALKDIR
jgi:DNA-directed RNA polymerase specialized sigma24 family protein